MTADAGPNGRNSRIVPLFMMISIVALPFVGLALGESLTLVSMFTALSLLVILRRLTAGLRQDRGSSIPFLRRLRNRLLFDRAQV